MKAAVLEMPRKLVVKDIPMRKCGKDEVLVKVKACGICGSDIRYFNGENPWALHTLGKNLPNPPNIILGHELAGEVVEVGNELLKHLIGKRVGVEPYNTCGMCPFCRTGRYNLCRQTRHIGHGAGWGEMDYFPGGMAEYLSVWATHVYELPDNVSYEEAAILDPMAVALHALSLSGIRPGSKVFVIGCGAVGLSIAQCAKVYGAARIFLSDVFRGALDVASKIPGFDLIDASTADVVEYIKDNTDGEGADVIFDTAGNRQTQEQAFNLLANSGTLVNLVANTKPVDFNLAMLSGERRIVGSSNNLYEDYLLAIELAGAKKIDTLSMITHRFGLDEVNKGFDVMLNKEETGALKVVINI